MKLCNLPGSYGQTYFLNNHPLYLKNTGLIANKYLFAHQKLKADIFNLWNDFFLVFFEEKIKKPHFFI